MRHHFVQDCKGDKNCRECKKRHHTLLHYPRQQSSGPPSSAQGPPRRVHHFVLDQEKVFFQVIPVEVIGPKKSKIVYAMCDTAAGYTLVDGALARELQIHGPREDIAIEGINRDVKKLTSSRITLNLRNLLT